MTFRRYKRKTVLRTKGKALKHHKAELENLRKLVLMKRSASKEKKTSAQRGSFNSENTNGVVQNSTTRTTQGQVSNLPCDLDGVRNMSDQPDLGQDLIHFCETDREVGLLQEKGEDVHFIRNEKQFLTDTTHKTEELRERRDVYRRCDSPPQHQQIDNERQSSTKMDFKSEALHETNDLEFLSHKNKQIMETEIVQNDENHSSERYGSKGDREASVESISTVRKNEDELNIETHIETCDSPNHNKKMNLGKETRQNPNQIKEIPSTFSIVITKTEWEEIKPETRIYGSKNSKVRRLRHNWTDYFADKINDVSPGCVLVYKYHHIKAAESRKVKAPFFFAKAICKGEECRCTYIHTITTEPKADQQEISVNITVTGKIKHSADELNRRHIADRRRQDIASEISSTSASFTYYKKLSEASQDKLKLGNYTTVPTPSTLRKIISDQMNKERLHSSVMAELQLLKESYESENNPYIRDLGLDPFTIIMFSDEQIKKVKFLSLSGNLQLYVDATGSVISNIPGQKRPYLYSVVIKPDQNLPPVSVADMITTDHTRPRIQLFLSKIIWALSKIGCSVQVYKVETDFSYAIIQASLKEFNGLSVKTYLTRCYEILTECNRTDPFTVHHICAAHMLTTFIRNFQKYKTRTSKSLRSLTYSAFAALQNTATLAEAEDVFRDLCIIFMSRRTNEEVNSALERLQERVRRTEIETDTPVSTYSADLKIDKITKTIKGHSPFTKIFERISAECSRHVNTNTSDKQQANDYHCPEVITCLNDKFMYLLPLWTGLMLVPMKRDEIFTRDTNSAVEDWFKIIKHDIGLSLHTRPSKFVIALRKAVTCRLLEQDYPLARKGNKRRGKVPRDESLKIETKEEVWKPKRKKKYHEGPAKLKGIPSVNTEMNFPTVMKWGGVMKDFNMSNTCTIDNCLTVLHLKYRENETFGKLLREYTNTPVCNALCCVFQLMDEKQFSEAKMKWLSTTNVSMSTRIDLFGDEFDFFIKYIDGMWQTRTITTCSNERCTERLKESRAIYGVTTRTSGSFESLQILLDMWMVTEDPCHVDQVEDFTTTITVLPCSGLRRTERHIVTKSPILAVRVYEHCLYSRISLSAILSKQEITVGTAKYALGGVTMFKNEHFTAIVTSKKYGNIWYDGLKGKLDRIPSDVNTWFPCHALFCEVGALPSPL